MPKQTKEVNSLVQNGERIIATVLEEGDRGVLNKGTDSSTSEDDRRSITRLGVGVAGAHESEAHNVVVPIEASHNRVSLVFSECVCKEVIECSMTLLLDFILVVAGRDVRGEHNEFSACTSTVQSLSQPRQVSSRVAVAGVNHPVVDVVCQAVEDNKPQPRSDQGCVVHTLLHCGHGRRVKKTGKAGGCRIVGMERAKRRELEGRIRVMVPNHRIHWDGAALLFLKSVLQLRQCRTHILNKKPRVLFADLWVLKRCMVSSIQNKVW